jgi:CRISPR-associated endonuclease Csn1
LPNPWGLAPDAFFTAMQQLISDVIIYHADRDNVLKQTKRKERVKRQIVYVKDKEGNDIPKYQTGRGIRASLHKDTFYGAIKIPIKENGKLKTDENGKLLLEKDDKGNDIIKYRSSFVFRGNTVDTIKKNIENIVDERLKELAKEIGAATIQKQGYFEIPPSEERLKKNADAEATKVFKVKVFADSLQNPLQIKKHRDVKREHKQWYYTQTDGNYLMALYDNGKEKDFELINTFQLSELIRMEQGQYPLYKEKLLRGKQIQMPLLVRNGKDVVLKPGLKVLLCEKSFDEITSDLSASNLIDRLYSVSGLTVQRIKSVGNILEYGTIQLMHNLEAKPLGELKIQDGEYKFGDNKKYRKMNHNQFKAMIEGIDFTITRDGKIHLIQTKKDA